MLIALGVVLSTFYVFVAVYKGWDQMSFIVKANRIWTLTFAVLVWLAYRYRKNAIWHKRFLYVGTLLVLAPILDRVADKLFIESFMNLDVFNMIIWNFLFGSLFVYDWLTLKRVHSISAVGLMWFYQVWFFAEFI
jgi:hypothetical protein